MDAMLELPPGYRRRPPRRDESADVDRLSTACDAALGAAPSLSEELVVRMWARPRFDLATDATIVEWQGAVVGYAQVWAEDATHLTAFALVHPEHTGRGIGSGLATLIERRAAELADGEAELLIATIPQDEAAARLLTARGYAFARRFWQMEAELSARTAAGAGAGVGSPADILVRTVDPEQDLAAVHRVLEDALADHWNNVPQSYAEFLAQNVHQDDFDAGLWFIALDDGQPVGALTGSAHGDRGAVDLLGVVRSHRGRGIAAALLRVAFDEFRRRGLARARVSVDSSNPTGAVALYERVGMHVASEYDLWIRGVTGARATGARATG
ncbi:MAG TPA: GNAT family N-acetyltransferase [Candidatus Limnocylindrales bacterium]|jgi:mycothiol synthase|nr:GNAT family N-acetyltransferase [Candidatus Limnocylindrales bacterium]